jgi:hypothetical protein
MICSPNIKLCELEKKILHKFEKKYILRNDIGREYFEGNYMNMIDDIYEILKNDRH